MSAGHWHPGYYRPVTPPPAPGYVWEDGYWVGQDYVDGYWRIEEIDGMIWIDGEYDDSGEYDDGYWAEADTGAPVDDEALPADVELAVPYVPDEESGGEELHHAPPTDF